MICLISFGSCIEYRYRIACYPLKSISWMLRMIRFFCMINDGTDFIEVLWFIIKKYIDHISIYHSRKKEKIVFATFWELIVWFKCSASFDNFLYFYPCLSFFTLFLHWIYILFKIAEININFFHISWIYEAKMFLSVVHDILFSLDDRWLKNLSLIIFLFCSS